jgi:hypothetical protein
MLSLALPGRIFACTLPPDMRKRFDSLTIQWDIRMDTAPKSTQK